MKHHKSIPIVGWPILPILRVVARCETGRGLPEPGGELGPHIGDDVLGEPM